MHFSVIPLGILLASFAAAAPTSTSEPSNSTDPTERYLHRREHCGNEGKGCRVCGRVVPRIAGTPHPLYEAPREAERRLLCEKIPPIDNTGGIQVYGLEVVKDGYCRCSFWKCVFYFCFNNLLTII